MQILSGTLHVRKWVRDNIGGRNLTAGLAVGAFLIPQAIAYGQLAGVGAGVGLAIAAIPLILYPLIGRHTWISMGPESAVALMAAATAAPIAATHGVNPVIVLALLALGTGAILLLARLARAAVVTDLLSKPVLTGYLTGVAILMVASQLGNAVGAPVDTDSLLALASSLFAAHVNWTSVGVCAATVALIVGLRLRWRRVPGVLIALILTLPAGYFLAVDTIGNVTIALPTPSLASLDASLLIAVAYGAAAIAIVSYTDVIVTARAFADGQPVNANRELTALGVSQMAVGLAGGYPVSASSSRTAIARDSGATSRFYSWTVAAVAIITPLVASGLISYIPKATLAGIVMVAAWSLIDVRAWRELRQLRLSEVAVAAGCVIGVLTLGILGGIAVAVAFSVSELLVRLARPHDAILGVVPGLPGMHDIDDYPEADTFDGIVVFRFDAPLFFANANTFYNACMDAADTPGCRWFILNVESNVEVDSTGLDALKEVALSLAEDGKHLALARVKKDLLDPMTRYGIVDIIGEDNVHPTLPVAIETYMRALAGDGENVPAPKSLKKISPVHRFARTQASRQIGKQRSD